MTNWLCDHGHEWSNSQKKLYNKLIQQLDLPIGEGALYNGYKTIEFDCGAVYNRCVERQWIESVELDKASESQAPVNEIKDIIYGIVDQAVINSEYFNF